MSVIRKKEVVEDVKVYVHCGVCGRRIGTYRGEVLFYIYSLDPFKPAKVLCRSCFKKELEKRGLKEENLEE